MLRGQLVLHGVSAQNCAHSRSPGCIMTAAQEREATHSKSKDLVCLLAHAVNVWLCQVFDLLWWSLIQCVAFQHLASSDDLTNTGNIDGQADTSSC